jgi:tetratricopeptide (TPR) repeat protein
MRLIRRLLPGVFFAFASLLALESASNVESARSLLAAGHVDEAEKLIRRNPALGSDPAAQAVLGDILFRRADFEGAARSYQAALAVNPKCARAYWGLGRIELAQFRGKSARDFMARAFGLDPRDPEIIASYADFMEDATSRSTLLWNVVQLTQHSDLRRAEESLGRLEIERRLNGNRPARLESPYKGYAIQLSLFQPVSFRPDGLTVPVRINHGRVLHLLLDTGANGIAVSARTAAQLGLEPVTASGIAGLGGSGGLGSATRMLAKSVSIGELSYENCLVDATRQTLTSGADGVIGMNLFEAFEIRLDARARLLQLTPFAEQPSTLAYDRHLPKNSGKSALVYGFRHLLLMPAKVKDREGLFLLDTGSAATTISRDFGTPALPGYNSRPFTGVNGEIADALRLSPVTLRIAGRNYSDREPVSVDLSELSQRQGVQISGILGFSALRYGPVTINYRDGLVDLGTRH